MGTQSGCEPNYPKKPVPRRISEVDWETWTPRERAVLCYVHKSGRVLLIHKKTGLGAGKINAPGGRLQKGETPKEAHKLPFYKIWADNILWVPRILGGEYIKARFIFNNDNMLDQQVECFKR